jgi:hypothetical protein
MPTVNDARMPLAGEIEQLFEDGEVRSPVSVARGAGKRIDGPFLVGAEPLVDATSAIGSSRPVPVLRGLEFLAPKQSFDANSSITSCTKWIGKLGPSVYARVCRSRLQLVAQPASQDPDH